MFDLVAQLREVITSLETVVGQLEGRTREPPMIASKILPRKDQWVRVRTETQGMRDLVADGSTRCEGDQWWIFCYAPYDGGMAGWFTLAGVLAFGPSYNPRQPGIVPGSNGKEKEMNGNGNVITQALRPLGRAAVEEGCRHAARRIVNQAMKEAILHYEARLVAERRERRNRNIRIGVLVAASVVVVAAVVLVLL